MKKVLLASLIILAVSVLISCSAVTVEDYKASKPEINLQDFFSGDLVAYGIVRNRSGKMIRHFSASLKGSWKDGVGTLDEVFWFNDGERQTRVWTLTPDGNGEFRGTASDVEGEAMIKARGNAVNLTYKLRVPYKENEIVLTMDDWMYQIAPGVILNETLMTKWGFEVGKVTLIILRADVIDAIPQLVSKFDSQ